MNYLVTFWRGEPGAALFVEDEEFANLKTARKHAQLWAREGQAVGFPRVASVFSPEKRGERRHIESVAFKPGRGVFASPSFVPQNDGLE